MEGATVGSGSANGAAAPAAGHVLLAGHGIARRYGRRVALMPTDLELRAGEAVFLVGPNGAGKSTLLAILAGALPPSEGTVTSTLPSTAIGWAPQRPALYRHLSARENLVLFARLQRLPDPVAEAERMLREVELPDDDRVASQLSVGNQQRLNLALGFLGRPQVLLLDEPTASLDPQQAHALWQRVDRVQREGAAVAVATHLLAETAHAGRVLALREGRVVFAGSPEQFRAWEVPA